MDLSRSVQHSCPQVTKGLCGDSSPLKEEGSAREPARTSEDATNPVAVRGIHFPSYGVLGSQASNSFLGFYCCLVF